MKFSIYKNVRVEWVIYLLLFLVYVFFVPKGAPGWDQQCWIRWATYSFENGLANVYSSDTNYLPLYHYFLYLYGLFEGSTEDIAKHFYRLQFITLIFDFAGVIIVLKLLKEKVSHFSDRLFWGLLLLLNFSYLYNTVLWGQVDGILSFFIFASVYLAYRERAIGSLVCYILAINFKLQAIVFLPLVGLILLPLLIRKFSIQRLLLWIVTIAGLQTLILLPFILNGSLGQVADVVVGSVDKYPKVSLEAYNFWYLILSENPHEILDTNKFGGLSYKNWGMLLFFIFSFLALLPLLINVFRQLISKVKRKIDLNFILLTGALLATIFFYFNTQMHERYVHPAFLFIAAFSFLNRKYWLYIIFSLAYILSLEKASGLLKVPWRNAVIFEPVFIAVLYSAVLSGLFYELWKRQRVQKHSQKDYS